MTTHDDNCKKLSHSDDSMTIGDDIENNRLPPSGKLLKIKVPQG